MAENHVLELERLEGLLTVQSAEEMRSCLGQLVGSLGFDHFACGVMDFNGQGQAPSVRLISAYPIDWQAHYDASGYFTQDLVISHTLRDRKPIPMVWPTPGTLDDAIHDQIFAEASDFGMRSGLTVSCQGASQIGVLSVSSDQHHHRIKQEMARALGTVQLLACYLQEVWNGMTECVKPYQTSKLSPRELECLHWAAVGKTSWEIGNILKIAERTVVFHIGRAVEKLEVSNRRQAVAKAITLGLISP